MSWTETNTGLYYKKKEIIKSTTCETAQGAWFTPKNPARSQRNRHLHENNNVAPPYPQQVNLLYCLCAVSQCAVSRWHIYWSFNTHWQIYQGNVHSWWACFYIWDRRGLGAKQKEKKKDVKTGQGYMTYRMCTTHTLTHKHTFCSHSQSQQRALPSVSQGCSDAAAARMWREVYT